MLKYTFVQSLVVLDGGCDGVQVSDCDNHHKEKYTLDQTLGNHYNPFWKHIQGNLKVSWCDWILVHLRDNTMMDVHRKVHCCAARHLSSTGSCHLMSQERSCLET